MRGFAQTRKLVQEFAQARKLMQEFAQARKLIQEFAQARVRVQARPRSRSHCDLQAERFGKQANQTLKRRLYIEGIVTSSKCGSH